MPCLELIKVIILWVYFTITFWLQLILALFRLRISIFNLYSSRTLFNSESLNRVRYPKSHMVHVISILF